VTPPVGTGPVRLGLRLPLPGNRVGIRLAVVLAAGLILPACGSDAKSSPTANSRPFTPARIQIISPPPNEVTGPDVTVVVNLIGAHEVQASAGTIRPDESHIHVSVDGNVVAMAYSTTQELKGLTSGPHSVQVEFVAIDHHLPFRNRVIAAVLFTVK
jgi:hypothetical protein